MEEKTSLRGEFGTIVGQLMEQEEFPKSEAFTGFAEHNDPMMVRSGFFSDDDEDASHRSSFESGFDAMEKREREKTGNMLLETEFKLFHEQHDYAKLAESQAQKAKLEEGQGRERFRYYSLGYGANVDQVDDLEISRWQSRFPYFHVVGLGEEPREDEQAHSGNSNCHSQLSKHHGEAEEDDLVIQGPPLVIVGQKMTIQTSAAASALTVGYEGELIVQDGIEEEIILIHSDPEEKEVDAQAISTENFPY